MFKQNQCFFYDFLQYFFQRNKVLRAAGLLKEISTNSVSIQKLNG